MLPRRMYGTSHLQHTRRCTRPQNRAILDCGFDVSLSARSNTTAEPRPTTAKPMAYTPNCAVKTTNAHTLRQHKLAMRDPGCINAGKFCILRATVRCGGTQRRRCAGASGARYTSAAKKENMTLVAVRTYNDGVDVVDSGRAKPRRANDCQWNHENENADERDKRHLRQQQRQGAKPANRPAAAFKPARLHRHTVPPPPRSVHRCPPHLVLPHNKHALNAVFRPAETFPARARVSGSPTYNHV